METPQTDGLTEIPDLNQLSVREFLVINYLLFGLKMDSP